MHTAATKFNMVAPRQGGVSKGIVRVELECLFQQGNSRRRSLRHQFVDKRQCPQDQIIGIEALWPLAFDAFHLERPQSGLDRADNAQGDLVLHLKDVAEQAVVALAPELPAALRLDEL